MQILALVAEYRERMEEQVVVLFQVLAAEINFGYKFQTVQTLPLRASFPLQTSPLAHAAQDLQYCCKRSNM